MTSEPCVKERPRCGPLKSPCVHCLQFEAPNYKCIAEMLANYQSYVLKVHPSKGLHFYIRIS